MNTIIEDIEKQIKGLKARATKENVGVVSEIGDGIARIEGLSEVKASELLDFGSGIFGLALNLEQYNVGAVIFGDFTKIKQGSEVKTTGQILEVPVGENFVGRVIDGLGKPLDGKGPIKAAAKYPVEQIAPGVIKRKSVDTPLQTGIKAIDAIINQGQTSNVKSQKTSEVNDAVICIYVAIGQKTSKIAQLVAKLEEQGAMEHTIIVSASASDPAPMQYIAPYSGTALGEYFMDQGRDALIIYDDLSKHAQAYRQMSLLLRRPSGREASPGDVFYLHSRLLERSAKLEKGGSLTALPIIETQASDNSAYIPTNVISITDGQIYLEGDLFYAGVRPALNVGLSVSRVGGAAQTKAMKKVAGQMRLDLAQFRALQAFAQFSSDLDPATKAQIERGQRLSEILKQLPYAPVPVEEQVAILWAGTNGYLDEIPVEKVKEFEKNYLQHLRLKVKKLLAEIAEKKELDDKIVKDLEKITKEFVVSFKKGLK